MKAKSNKSGICPICNTENITYSSPEFCDGETIYYPYICENCKTKGEEYYKIKIEFIGHNVIDEQGSSVEIEEVEE